jgi:hypothetical protein
MSIIMIRMIETMRYSKLFRIVIGVLFTICMWNDTVAAGDLPKMQWEVVYADDNFEYECLGSGVSETDALWLVVGSRPVGKLSGPQNLSLWRIDSSGNVAGKIDVQGLSDRNDVRYARVQAMAVKDGTVLLAMESEDHAVYLVRMDEANGKVVFTKDVGTRSDSILVKKILLTGDDGYLLIGRKMDSAVIIKMDMAGNIIWKKIVSNEKVSMFTDGVEDDSGFSLAGSYIDSSGVTSLWVGKFDLNGKLLLKKELNGRYAAIAKDGEAGYVILNDVAGPKGWDVWVHWLTSDLTESTGAMIAANIEMYRPFKTGNISQGEFMTVGAKESRLWLLRGKKGGDIIWSHVRRDMNTTWEKIWNFDLIESKGNVYIPYTMFRVNEKMEQRQIIKVIKLAK